MSYVKHKARSLYFTENIAVEEAHNSTMAEITDYAFLHTEIYHVALPLEKSLNFYCNVYSIRLLASALAYLSSDIYRSPADYLATVSERALQLDVVG